MTDYLIIGGGIMGLLSARELVSAGARVTLLERGRTGKESSWAGGGILSPLYPWRYPDPVSELARWSQGVYPQLAKELTESTGIDPQHTVSGLLVLDDKDQSVSDWAARYGQAMRHVGSDDIRVIEPSVSQEYQRGTWFPEIAQIRNPRLAKALRVDVEQRGVEIRENTSVTGIRTSDGRVLGVETERGPVDADCVIVAGGAWTRDLLAPTGLELPIQPVRGQMVLYRTQPGFLKRIVLADGHYVIPRRDGRVIVGSTLEYVGFEKETTDVARSQLTAIAEHMVPGISSYPLETHWAGLRPGNPVDVPVIGEHPFIQGLYVNSGHFRNGVVLAPASCRLLSDLILKRPQPILDPQFYQTNRSFF